MNRILHDLRCDFHEKINMVLLQCLNYGYHYIPYFGARTLHKQAKLWRQSRCSSEIICAINKLKVNKAHTIANILDSVGPQYGKWATNALPGLSWHNHKLACDFYYLKNGRAIWDVKEYRVLAEVAKEQGLESGYFWELQDAVHIQENDSKVLDVFTWQELDDLFS